MKALLVRKECQIHEYRGKQATDHTLLINPNGGLGADFGRLK